MNSTTALRAAHRTPLIKFLGKRVTPKSIDHTPQPHPASPESELPTSFAAYRAKAQQHGPLTGHRPPQRVDSKAYGSIGGSTGASLGPVKPPSGTAFDRADLPHRFGRLEWSEAEMEAINSGGAPL